MSSLGLVDEVLALATQAAIESPERRAILLAEIDARLANADVQSPRASRDLEALRAEVQRLSEAS